MPVRPRRRRRLHELTPSLAASLCFGPPPGAPFPTDEALEAAWAAWGAHLTTSYPPARRPWAWWAFEPGVPDELRGDRPQLVLQAEAADLRMAAELLDEARRAWLADTSRR